MADEKRDSFPSDSVIRKGADYMALQLIFGGSGAGKSHFLFEHIIGESIKYPQKNYLIVVPEQFTMQTQKELVMRHPRGGILNIDILSFDRLAYRVFQEVGANTRSLLEEIGKSFVLQKIGLDKEKELPFLGRNMKKPGYIYEMKSLISELAQYDIHLEDLEEMIRAAARRPKLAEKLKDVKIVYEAFSDYMEGKYMTAEDVMDVLAALASESELLRNSEIAFDGFTGFTPVQYKVFGEVLRLSPMVYMTITMGEEADPYTPAKEQELFAMSKKTTASVCDLAVRCKVELLPEIRIPAKEQSRFGKSDALAFLEKNLFRFQKERYENSQEEIHIYKAKNPLAEVQMAASRIRRLVRKEGYRYGEIALITGNLTSYGNYVRQVFSSSEIPYFIDEKRSVLTNPYIEYLRGLMDVEKEHYSIDSVFRYLRCGMSDITSEETDQLENYCLALGIRGYKKWSEKWVRIYQGMDPEEMEYLDGIRRRVMEELEPFHQAIRKKQQPLIRDYVCAVYEAGMDRHVQEKLKEKEVWFEKLGRLDLVKEYTQIYGKVMSFLDKLVDVLGEERAVFSDFQTIMEAGFSEIRIGIIPPSVDQILVGDMERTRLKDIKVLLFLGVNEGLIPKSAASGGILSETDREFLHKEAFQLKPSAKENMYIQKFYLYLSLTKASERLYLSYSCSDSEGKVIGPAYLIHTLEKMYPMLQTEEEAEQLLDKIEAPESAMEYLIEGLRLNAVQEPDPCWKELYSWYAKNPDYAQRLYTLVDATHKTSPQDTIGKAAARALYGTTLENSATRLERFAACAFAHFLQYGLQLRERKQYEFTGMDLGNIVHTVLEHFAKKVSAYQYDWHTMSEEVREKLIAESMDEVIHDYGNTILHSSARNEYMIQRVYRILSRTVWALQEQIRRSDFVPNRFEVSFHMDDTLKSVNVDLNGEEKMRLKGRIDRLDTYEDEDHIYIKVMDYKSGSTAFDLVSVYHGLQLQLILYMNVTMELMNQGKKEVQPAGVFYYNVKDPMEEWKENETEEELKLRILKDLRVNGLVQDSNEVIGHLDLDLADGASESAVIPVKYNKNGTLSASSSAVSLENFRQLSEHVNHKISQIGRDILAGQVSVNPYEKGASTACDYCPYQGVCGFDGRIPGYEYRKLGKIKPEDIWEKMEKEAAEHGNEMDTGATESHRSEK